MRPRIAVILGWLRRLGASRSDLLIGEPQPKMRAADRLFWVTLRCFWPRWTSSPYRPATFRLLYAFCVIHHTRRSVDQHAADESGHLEAE